MMREAARGCHVRQPSAGGAPLSCHGGIDAADAIELAEQIDL